MPSQPIRLIGQRRKNLSDGEILELAAQSGPISFELHLHVMAPSSRSMTTGKVRRKAVRLPTFRLTFQTTDIEQAWRVIGRLPEMIEQETGKP